MLVRLADFARLGARDPRTLVGPLVESVLQMRRTARAERRFADADALRDSLVGLGVEIRDTSEGTDWDLPAGFGEPRPAEPAEAL
jgi:cysteinyl-tRNA synthetase